MTQTTGSKFTQQGSRKYQPTRCLIISPTGITIQFTIGSESTYIFHNIDIDRCDRDISSQLFRYFIKNKKLLIPFTLLGAMIALGLPPLGSAVKNHMQLRSCRRHRFDPWVGKIPWRRVWQPTPLFLPGESHGQRSLAGYKPQNVPKSLTGLKRLSMHMVSGIIFSLSNRK